jgi:hypothetical protein
MIGADHGPATMLTCRDAAVPRTRYHRFVPAECVTSVYDVTLLEEIVVAVEKSPFVDTLDLCCSTW